jgi:hypothetical protein
MPAQGRRRSAEELTMGGGGVGRGVCPLRGQMDVRLEERIFRSVNHAFESRRCRGDGFVWVR